MLSLAAAGLGRMPPDQIPTSLRKAASFTPSRRAKLAGHQIGAAIDTDDEFREHLAAEVKALVPDVVAGLEAGSDPGAAASVDAAAAAYIIRPEGWQQVVDAAHSTPRPEPQAHHAVLAQTVDRLTSQLDAARAQTKHVRERLRGQVDELKQRNTHLRQSLGSTRQELKTAQQIAAQAMRELDLVRREAEVAKRTLDAEIRRLRARIGELEAVTASARRATRGERDAETMRLRLLLDTMVDATAGIRRELALPPSDVLPADTVASVEPGVGTIGGIGRALLDDDPELLRRLLELPRVHLVIDGYNVSKTAWPTAPLDQQRSRLAGSVTGLVAGKRIETTIVFDGADLLDPPPVPASRAVRVRFSPPGVIADDLIRQLVAAEPTGRPIVVVSTDREVAESVTKMGARAVSATALLGALGL
jgi:predicted RNA-binding protein with PIN domain